MFSGTKPVTAHFHPEELPELRDLARQQRTSVSELVRQAAVSRCLQSSSGNPKT